MIKGLEYLEYRERLVSLGLWTLEERRNRADLLEVYKIHSGLSRVEMKEFFEVINSERTRRHSVRISKKHSALDQRVVNRWNALDQKVIDASSVNI